MINYGYIERSCRFYEQKGFTRLEVPWWASKDVVHITKPADIKDREDFYLPVNDMVLVSSAEQSFLALAKESKMPVGRFFAVTPCFRNEHETAMSCKYFLKTELIDTSIRADILDDVRLLGDMVNVAMGFFREIVPSVELLKLVCTDEGWDIEYGGVEIGSYGIRFHEYMNWVYGTGVAEPRLSRAIAKAEHKYDWPLL